MFCHLPPSFSPSRWKFPVIDFFSFECVTARSGKLLSQSSRLSTIFCRGENCSPCPAKPPLCAMASSIASQSASSEVLIGSAVEVLRRAKRRAKQQAKRQAKRQAKEGRVLNALEIANLLTVAPLLDIFARSPLPNVISISLDSRSPIGRPMLSPLITALKGFTAPIIGDESAT